MRALLLSLICMATGVSAWGQPFMGLYATQNSITEIRENPAFTVTQDRAQINIASAGAEIGGNSIVFKPGAYNFLAGSTIAMDKDYYRSYDPHQKQMWASVEAMGPGASFRIKRRYFVAVTTGVRYLMNSDNLTQGVFNLLGTHPYTDTNKTDSFKIHNYSIASQVFREVNLSYGGFLYESEDYNLIGGVTLKLLSGMGAAGMGIGDASFKIKNNDGTAYNTTGNVNVAFTPYANSWAITNNPFQSYNNRTGNFGVGADIGVVYYINPNETMQLKRGYEARIAMSITDIGSISYTASSTSGAYAITNKDISYRGIGNNTNATFGNQILNGYLADGVATVKGSSSKFKVRLPTAFHFNADLKVEPRLYVNTNLLLNLVTPSADKFTNHYISTLTITPRYMVRDFGVALPFSFNAIKQGYVGVIVFLGPVYIGSGSLYEMATSSSIYNANAYAGFTWRVKPKRKKEKDIMMM